MAKNKVERALEQEYDRIYSRLGSGVQVDVFDLGKMRAEALQAVRGGATMEQAVQDTIARYRKN